jgi:hypothetical protein
MEWREREWKRCSKSSVGLCYFFIQQVSSSSLQVSSIYDSAKEADVRGKKIDSVDKDKSIE